MRRLLTCLLAVALVLGASGCPAEAATGSHVFNTNNSGDPLGYGPIPGEGNLTWTATYTVPSSPSRVDIQVRNMHATNCTPTYTGGKLLIHLRFYPTTGQPYPQDHFTVVKCNQTTWTTIATSVKAGTHYRLETPQYNPFDTDIRD